LLFQFHAFQTHQVLGTLNGIFQRPIRVIELRGLFQAPFLLTLVRAGIKIGMKLPAQLVKLPLQGGDIDVQLPRQSEEQKVVDGHWRLHLAAGTAKVFGAHGAA